MSLSPHIPPPPPLPPQVTQAQCRRKSNDTVTPGEVQSPLQEILYAVRKLPHWRAEEDLDPADKSTWLAVSNHVVPLVQDGPTCGLVVLKLALLLLEKERVEVCDLLEEARNRKFTYQGEMFSAKNMLNLATAISGCSGQVLSGGLEEHRQTIIDRLQEAHPVLVPYDADPNHEPGCHGGHKAHWSLLTGYLTRVPSSKADAAELEEDGFSSDPACPHLFIAQRLPLKKQPCFQKESELFVFGRQGKSRHLGVWSFHSLSESNNNLREFTPSREADEYLLPPGGVEEGLRGKAVILQS